MDRRFSRTETAAAAALSLLGLAALAAAPAAHAQRYNIIDLGTLGGADAAGHQLNSYGYAVGRARTGLPGGEQHAAFFGVWWGVWDLTAFLPSPYQSIASDINDSFQVTGWNALGNGAVAWVTTPGAWEPTYIGTLGGNYSIASGINEAGQVVGTSDNRFGQRRAFRWTAGAFTELGALSTTGPGYSFGSSTPSAATIRPRWWSWGLLAARKATPSA